MRIIDFQGIPNIEATDQSASVTSTATLLTALATIHANTKFVRVTVDTDDVRYTVSGTTPTASLGRRVPVDGGVLLSQYEISTAKFVRVTTNATIQVAQYKA
jgi:hypothetical protein